MANFLVHLIILFYQISEKFVLKQGVKKILSNAPWPLRATLALTPLLWLRSKLLSYQNQPLMIFYVSATICHVFCIGFYLWKYYAKKKVEEATQFDFCRRMYANFKSPVYADMATKADTATNRNTLLQFQIGNESDKFTKELIEISEQFENSLKKEAQLFTATCNQFEENCQEHKANLQVLIAAFQIEEDDLLNNHMGMMRLQRWKMRLHQDSFKTVIAQRTRGK